MDLHRSDRNDFSATRFDEGDQTIQEKQFEKMDVTIRGITKKLFFNQLIPSPLERPVEDKGSF